MTGAGEVTDKICVHVGFLQRNIAVSHQRQLVGLTCTKQMGAQIPVTTECTSEVATFLLHTMCLCALLRVMQVRLSRKYLFVVILFNPHHFHFCFAV